MKQFACVGGCALAIGILAGCSSDAPNGQSKSALQIDGGVAPFGQCGRINANIGSKFIEIEALGATVLQTRITGSASVANGTPSNANLYRDVSVNDKHPSDGTPIDFDYANPGTGALTDYVDWADLPVGQHTCDDVTTEKTAFGSGSCVFSGGSPKKGDITGTAFASNAQFLYLGITRKDNNGTVGFTYVFTKRPSYAVACTCSSGGCGEGFEPKYELRANDIVIRGLYPGATEQPVIKAYKYKGPDLNVAAGGGTALNGQALIQSLSDTTKWTEVSSTGGGGIVAAANLDKTRATAVLPTDPVGESTINGSKFINERIALEMAVPMNALVAEGFSVCNAGSFNVDVITQSSDTPNSDLKDYIGGIALNLGELSADVPAVTTGCDGKLTYRVDAITARDGSQPTKDANGEFPGFKCDWSCTSPGQETRSFPNDCAATQTGLPPGNWTCSVTISETAGDGCSKTYAKDAATVRTGIVAGQSMTGTCAKTFSYGAAPSGGSGGYACAWSFAGGSTLSSASSTSCSGGPITVNAGSSIAPGGVAIGGTLTVTDSAGCEVTVSADTKVYQGVDIQIAPSTASLACPMSTSTDEVSFTGTITGGSVASPTASWTGCVVQPDGRCKVDFTGNAAYCPSGDVYASVVDPICGNDTSATYTVAKTTSITAALKP